ncbi:tRNA guanosine(34) transglycosylase Tgt [Candidatus Woesebacteria bacterium CG_4_10_14_0_2_um_filter_39_14]|uniref:Queuine tRNA-ribosyltransferase n=2 Tax=Microgenomates group TaxID=1794810 RepID=A0A2M6YPD4_9BACT|nr:MAG: tRNA guanosine(34) transglycosylase Tgt [Candidatus Shapirobacteria bacterium CG07_land_8_20_14_0_80_39_12]PIZ49668.1 MAG: tRNA guanosine(34) transglycosylase Tgt [Candidatus Woesebacteria bacterium CG_4_10_14_0_2_um_filter_39_14]
MANFKILSADQKTMARRGEITTSHGKILTPAFVPVGSQATVKSLTPHDLKEIGTQVFFVNTYHLYLRPGAEMIEKLGGLHQFMKWDGPIMTDSGGFQVFSLGRRELVKIDYHGVTFYSHLDGSKHRFTPEKSIEVQQKLKADMMVAFDECAPYPTTHVYAETAMKRTHRWALRSLAAKKRKDQFLFGVIQGSVYKDLREQSTKFISSLEFDGIAIGGVAVGESKKEMIQVLDWVMPILTKEKKQRPIHLLGVGEIDDIFAAVEKGIDMMDCVMPTRLARMGWILTQNPKLKNKDFRYDITKSKFADNKEPPDPDCDCYLCRNFSRAYLHHLFRTHELLAYRLATYHNLFFIEQLFVKIREAIKKGEFLKLKKQWLGD